MQHFQLQLKNIPAFDIFDRLFQISLNYKLEGGEPSHRNSDPIEFKNFSLLLAWPGILALELATITGRGNYKKELASLRNLLKEGAGYTEIRNLLDNLLVYTPVPEELIKEKISAQKSGNPKKIASIKKKIREFQPELFETLNLLFDQKFIVKEHSIYFELLKFLLGNYHIMCLMVAKHLTQDKKAYITSEDITAILDQCGIENQPNIYYVSRFWYQELLKISNDAISTLNKNLKPLKEIGDFLTTRINIPPSLKFSLNKLNFDKNGSFAFISKHDTSLNKIKVFKTKGFAHKISPNNFSGYDLWLLNPTKNINERKETNRSFLFLSDKKHGADELENLLYQFYQVALYSSGIMNSLIKSWGDFIDDAEDMIDSNLIGFKDWYFSVIKDYKTRNQLLKFKPVLRIIKNLEDEIENEIAKKISKKFKKAAVDHLPDDIREKVLKANEELIAFIKLVRKKYPDSLEKRGNTKNLLILFDTYKEECEYLKFLNHEQVDKDIKFETSGNYLKDTQTKILPVIYEGLTGETITGAALMRELSLDSPSDYNPYIF